MDDEQTRQRAEFEEEMERIRNLPPPTPRELNERLLEQLRLINHQLGMLYIQDRQNGTSLATIAWVLIFTLVFLIGQRLW